jgi:hypothetical protein
MDLSEATRRAFEDELEKIGGGFSRSGIRPFKAETLAGKAGKFMKKNVMLKTSAGFSRRHIFAAATAGGAGAIYGQRKLKQMAEDYQTGKTIRMQQMGR